MVGTATSYYSNTVKSPVLDISDQDRFELSAEFTAKFDGLEPEWGPVGKFTYKRTYARPVSDENDQTEEFSQTLARIVNGVYTVQKWHCRHHNLPWSDSKAQRSAQTMFQLMWDFKFLPGGRGLWMMGTKYIERYGSAALNNCSFVSTEDIDIDFAEPFCFLMDFSMLGVGVGSDCRGAGKVSIVEPKRGDDVHVVPDTREGWVDLLYRVLQAYVGNGSLPKTVDYSQVRPYGAPIKGFGGTASGPDPLIKLIADVQRVLRPLVGQKITSEAIVDICDMVGVCVVAGNVRRTAIIMFGEADDDAFLNLKNPEINKEAMDSHRWASNNSMLASVGMDYTKTASIAAKAGEPGYIWLDSSRKFGRMGEPINDCRVKGYNPCQPIWAPVLTPDGIQTFGDIDVGSTIWSGKQWTKVTKKLSTGIKPVISYKTRAGTFYGTENHRVVQRGEKVEAKDADAIDTAPMNPEFIGNAGVVAARDVIDGLVLGDGVVHKASNDLVLLIVGQDDQDYFSSEVSGLMLEHRPGVRDGYWATDTSIKASELPKTYDREIPDRFYRGDVSTRRGFLRGLYSANGSVVASRVTLKASSLRVIEQSQQMLSSLGIRSYYTVNKSHDVEFANGTYTCRESYDLNIGPDRGLFRELIGFIHTDKSKRLDVICDKPISKYAGNRPKTTFDIVEREDLGEQEVFDITVDADEHTYWTGGLLVSNCGEISLESREMCNLVETFPSRHASYEEFERTLKFAYLYAKTVSLVPTHNPRTNMVTLRNRRIGVSQSGIIQSFTRHGRRQHFEWCDRGYNYIQKTDRLYSEWLCVRKSIKTTTVKPAGTTSLLPGVTPGIHYEHAEYYFRTVRIAMHSPLVEEYRKAGYNVEVDSYDNSGRTAVIYFPIKAQFFDRAKDDVSIWEQMENAAKMQKYWSDNSVSITVTFKPEEGADIQRVLELYESRLKTVSFLPLDDHGYVQAPYITIDQKTYDEASSKLTAASFNGVGHSIEDTPRYCDGDHCEVPVRAANTTEQALP